ncbi:SPOR domain-containing protein [Paludibacter sp. 221]|uniref:SPOR domain-containing protein n=1 Tax=Paludibacter sp. 221 TaxID=2302939 RepID=UPI0013D687A9|nr:SPOR domain-containing protein [Paludibacter sp. 221]NDV47606.1 SPOR domain-containing protein [Paludibacter sp. 221]
MKKNIQILAILVIFGLGASSCKSKQKVVTIPNAHVEATNQATETPAPKPAPVVVSQPEEVRDEKFSLDSEEKNTKILDQKYHVVVGSFKNRDNAKGLQQTLNTEGNSAVIVVNEHGMFRILLSSYGTYKDARTKVNQVLNRFPDAWILVQKEGN